MLFAFEASGIFDEDDDLGLLGRTNRHEIRAQPWSRLTAALCVYFVRRDQAALISPSCCNAVTASSRPISSTIMPSLSFRTVVPVKCILRPVAAGNDPTRKSLNAGPLCVPPPSQRPTT